MLRVVVGLSHEVALLHPGPELVVGGGVPELVRVNLEAHQLRSPR
jgi:hypothetical protein